MLGTKIYKTYIQNPNGGLGFWDYDEELYFKCSCWCNETGTATIEDKGEYYEVVAIPPYIPTEKEIQEQLERGIEAWMNTVVAERDYDSIDTCIARYTDSPNPKYAQEAKAVKDWNTLVWDKCWDILKEVKEGKRAIPTLEEVIAELPVLVW